MEAVLVMPSGWRTRLIAVYEDQHHEQHLEDQHHEQHLAEPRLERAPHFAELRHILSVVERQDDFPPDSLASLPYPLVGPAGVHKDRCPPRVRAHTHIGRDAEGVRE